MGSLRIPTLLTERLRLRAFRRSDLDDYAALYADPEVVRYLGTEPWDRGRSWRLMAFRKRSAQTWALAWPMGFCVSSIA